MTGKAVCVPAVTRSLTVHHNGVGDEASLGSAVPVAEGWQRRGDGACEGTRKHFRMKQPLKWALKKLFQLNWMLSRYFPRHFRKNFKK